MAAPARAAGRDHLRELEMAFPRAQATAATSALPFAWRLEQLDDRLAAKGFHPLSAWWREKLVRFMSSRCRRLVGRVGRRGGKGVTMARVAVLVALHGAYTVPPGEVGMFAFVSHKREEAAERIRNIRAILDAIDEPYHAAGGDILLERRPVLFRVLTASIAGVSGPTCIGAVCDEVAKWRDADTGSNPATEVLASLRPTMATQPDARLFMVSSPLGRLDAHAKAFDEGDSPGQQVAYAPTWVANPTLTEEGTKKDEPNEDIWRREYAAIPLEGSEESLFSPTLLTRATREAPEELLREPGVIYVAAMDPALVRNAWTFAIACKRRVGARIKRSVVLTREWRGTALKPLRPDAILAEIALHCRRFGVDTVDSDESHGQSLAVIAERPEIDLMVRVIPTTAPAKIERFETLATWLADGEVELPPTAQVRADLLGVRRLLTPNGWVVRLSETPDGRHCDHASSIPLALENARYEPDESVGAAPFGSPGYYAEQQERLIG